MIEDELKEAAALKLPEYGDGDDELFGGVLPPRNDLEVDVSNAPRAQPVPYEDFVNDSMSMEAISNNAPIELEPEKDPDYSDVFSQKYQMQVAAMEPADEGDDPFAYQDELDRQARMNVELEEVYLMHNDWQMAMKDKSPNLNLADDPKTAKMEIRNASYIARRLRGLGVTDADLSEESQYNYWRNMIAEQDFGGAGVGDDVEFDAQVAQKAKAHNEGKKFIKSLFDRASQSILGYEGGEFGFNKFIEEFKDHPGYNPEKISDYYKAWTAVTEDYATLSKPTRQALNEILASFQSIGTGEGYSRGDAANVQVDALMLLGDEDFKAALEAMKVYTSTMDKPDSYKFWQAFSTSFVRNVDSFVMGSAQSLQQRALKQRELGDLEPISKSLDAGPRILKPISKEERERRQQSTKDYEKMIGRRALVNSAFQNYDKIEGSKAGRWLGSAMGTTVTSLSMGVPYVGPLNMFLSMEGSARNDLFMQGIANGMGETQAGEYADGLKTFVALPQSVTEKLQSLLVFRGKMPKGFKWVDKALNKVDNAIANRLARFAGKAVIVTGAETGIELVQDIQLAIVQDIAAAFIEEYPDVNWKEELTGSWNSIPEIASEMVFLSLISAAGGRSPRAQHKAWRNITDLQKRAQGFSQASIDTINDLHKSAQQTGDYATFSQAIRDAKTDRESPEAIEAQKELDDMIKQRKAFERKMLDAAQAYGEGLPEFITGASGITVRDTKTGEIIGENLSPRLAMDVAQSHFLHLEQMSEAETAELAGLLVAQEAIGQKGGKGVISMEYQNALENAKKQGPEAEKRFWQQVQLMKEQDPEFDAATAVVFGANFEVDYGLGKGKEVVTKIFRGRGLMTVFHEEAHGYLRTAIAKKVMTWSGVEKFFKDLDRHLSKVIDPRKKEKSSSKFLPENYDSLSEEDKKTALDEAVAELMEVEIMRTRKKGGIKANMEADIIKRGITAAMQNRGTEAGVMASKMARIIWAAKNFWKIQLSRLVQIRAGIASGEISEADIEKFTNTLFGLDEQAEFDKRVDQEAQDLADINVTDRKPKQKKVNPKGFTPGANIRDAFMQNPVVNAIMGSGKLMSKSGAIKSKGKKWAEINASLWDDAPTKTAPILSEVYAPGGLYPDEVAQTLYDQGVLSEPTTTALWSEIFKAYDSAARIGGQQDAQDLQQAQDEEWQASMQLGGEVMAITESLEAGDILTIDGNDVVVEQVNDQGIKVDGYSRYGKQTIPHGEIYVDEVVKLREQQTSADGYADTPFSIGNQPAMTAKAAAQSASKYLENADTSRTAIPLLAKRKKMSKVTFADLLEEMFQGEFGEISNASEEEQAKVGKRLAAEVAYQLKKGGGTGMGWYLRKVKSAMATMRRVEPTFADHPLNEIWFTIFTALTSQGQAVDANFENGHVVYKSFIDNGRKFPTKISFGGEARGAMEANLEKLAALVDRLGEGKTLLFMLRQFSVGELKAAGFDVSGEAVDFVAMGSQLMGPKIGAFFANLNGNFDPVTMDLWFTRSMRRHFGRLFGRVDSSLRAKAKGKNKAGYLRRALKELRAKGSAKTELEQAAMDEILALLETKEGTITRQYILENAPALAQLTAEVDAEVQGMYTKAREEKRSSKTVKKTEFQQSMVGIRKAITMLEDAPTGQERPVMREIVEYAQEELRKSGINLTNADFQAILWFFEKDLYVAFDATSTTGEKTDYAEAAKKLERKLTEGKELAPRVTRSGGGGFGIEGRGAYEPVQANSPAVKRLLKSVSSDAASGAERSAAARYQSRASGRRPRGVKPDVAKQALTYYLPDPALRVDLMGADPAALTQDLDRLTKDLKSKSASVEALSDVRKREDLQTGAVELVPGAASSELFHSLITESKIGNKHGSSVYVYPVEDYASMRLFVMPDGKSGFALKEDGDLVSVFSTARGRISQMLTLAIQQGAQKLDCFNTVLPDIYAAHGFEVVAKTKWDNEQAPPDWDKDTYKAFNNGEPDVVFMVYKGGPRAEISQAIGSFPPANTKGIRHTSYDTSVARQQEATEQALEEGQSAEPAFSIGDFEPVASKMDAERRFADGKTLVAMHEMDEEIKPIKSIEMLSSYSYDTIYEVKSGASMSIGPVTPQMDAQYMAAVEAGDIEAAQELVDQAAKEAGYEIGPVYHGTNKDFNVFLAGVWGTVAFADSRETAQKIYAEGRSQSGGSPRVVDAYLKISNPYTAKSHLGAIAKAEDLKNQGFDGVIADTGVTAVFNPNQIKSADPITRDDAGNVIPLSERFNEQSVDIRYSLGYDMPSVPLSGAFLNINKLEDNLISAIALENYEYARGYVDKDRHEEIKKLDAAIYSRRGKRLITVATRKIFKGVPPTIAKHPLAKHIRFFDAHKYDGGFVYEIYFDLGKGVELNITGYRATSIKDVIERMDEVLSGEYDEEGYDVEGGGDFSLYDYIMEFARNFVRKPTIEIGDASESKSRAQRDMDEQRKKWGKDQRSGLEYVVQQAATNATELAVDLAPIAQQLLDRLPDDVLKTPNIYNARRRRAAAGWHGNYISRGNSAVTYVHEVMHVATQKRIQDEIDYPIAKDSIIGRGRQQPTGAEYLRRIKEQSKSASPEMQELVRLYLLANSNFPQLTKQSRTSGDPMFYQARKEGLPSDLGYGLANMHEFVAQTFSSKPFQEALNQIPDPKAKGMTLWQSLINAVRKMFGLKVEQGSVLESVIAATAEIAEMKAGPEVGFSIANMAATYVPETEQEVKAANSARSNKQKARSPILAVAAVRLANGEITVEDYADAVDVIDPFVAKGIETPPTEDEIRKYISSSKVAKVGVEIEPGTPVEARIDIPTWNASTAAGNSVYAVTLHEPVAKTAKKVGTPLSYVPMAHLKNVEMMTRAISGKGGAIRIATGQGKTPLATVAGEVVSTSVIPEDISEYAEVSYNPIRSSGFRDVSNRRLVIGGEEAVSIGSRVYVKNPEYGQEPTGFIDPLTPEADIRYSLGPAAMAGSLADAARRRMMKSPEYQMVFFENLMKRLQAIQAFIETRGTAYNFDAFGKEFEGKFSDEKEGLLNALAMMEAIQKSLPPDLRGRLGGGALSLAKQDTDEKRLEYLKGRVKAATKVVEQWTNREMDKALDKLFKREKVKKNTAGKKPGGKAGATIHEVFATLREYKDKGQTDVDAKVTGIEAQLNGPGYDTSEDESKARMELNLVGLIGNWREATVSRKIQAIKEATIAFEAGYYTYQLQKLMEKEDRDIKREELRKQTGKAGHGSERDEQVQKDQGLLGKGKEVMLDLLSFEDLLGFIFGKESAIVKRWVDLERKASDFKEDFIQNRMDALDDLFTALRDGNRFKGEELRWKMASQKTIKVQGRQFTEFEALSATMMWMQEDGRRHMEGPKDDNGKPQAGKWNYDQAFVDEIEAKLSDEAKQVRAHLMQVYGKEYGQINPTFKKLNGINLPSNALYSPITVKPVQGTDVNIDPTTGFAMGQGSATPGSLRTRGMAIAEPDFRDVVQTYISHTKQIGHYLGYAPMLQEVSPILRNRDLSNSVEASAGVQARKVLQKWEQYFHQGGVVDAAAQLAVQNLLGRMVGRAAGAILIGRISVIMIQSTQLLASIAEMPVGSFLFRFSKLMTGNLGWGKAFKSDYIQRRLKEMPVSVREAMKGLEASKPNRLKYWVQKAGRSIAGMDALMTAGTYAIVYDYKLKEAGKNGLTGQEAESYATNAAERSVDRVAQPTRAGTRSIFENNVTNPIARVGWAFASEARQKLALGLYRAGSKQRTLGEKGRALAVTWLVGGAFATLLRTMWRDLKDDEDDEVFDSRNWDPTRLILASLTGPLQGVPFLGSAIETGIWRATGEYMPDGDMLSAIPDAMEAAMDIGEFAEQDIDATMKDVETMLSGGALLNDTFAAAASVSHLVRDLYRAIKANLPDQ